MKMFITMAALAASLTACRTVDPVEVFGDADRVWTLKLLNGAPFPARATLTFPKQGEIAGDGPCNRYFGAMSAAYPAFNAGPIGSTRMACPEMSAETAFLAALEVATLSQAEDETLVLSNPDGLEMVFKATE